MSVSLKEEIGTDRCRSDWVWKGPGFDFSERWVSYLLSDGSASRLALADVYVYLLSFLERFVCRGAGS